jgi:hypothetical protein
MKKLLGALIALYASFAFGTTTVPVQLLNTAGSTAGQAVVSTGPSSAAAWGGIGLNGIAAIAANTVVANATGSSASPTAFAMPPCTTALIWTAGTGFVCNTSGAFTTLSAASNEKLFATNTHGQSVASSTSTTVTNWTTGFDVTSSFNATTGAFTVPTTGYYLVSAQIEYGSNAAGTWAATIVLNGTTQATGVMGYNATPEAVQVTAVLNCTSGQTITIVAFQTSGSSVSLSTTAAQTYLSIIRIP